MKDKTQAETQKSLGAQLHFHWLLNFTWTLRGIPTELSGFCNREIELIPVADALLPSVCATICFFIIAILHKNKYAATYLVNNKDLISQ